MENSRTRFTSTGRPLGPRPAGVRRVPHARLSARRAAILERLADQPQPTGVAALVAATGLHENTVREHLDALVASGLVDQTRAPAVGRGRPAWLYYATQQAEASAHEYAGLAAALAAQIERTSTSPRRDALEAGRSWGRDIAARDEAPEPATAASARRRVVALMDGLGFAPEPNARDTQARLTRCPLLQAAHQHPQVVCGVHLGIVQGALEQYGVASDQVERTDLVPFAEPGACRLHLLTRAGADRS